MNAIMDALAAHSSLSKQALDSERVRDGLKDVLLGLRNCGSYCGPRGRKLDRAAPEGQARSTTTTAPRRMASSRSAQ